MGASETVTCGELVVSGKTRECGKRCDVCTANREIGHVCYMQPLNDVLPPSDGVLYYSKTLKPRKILRIPKLLRSVFRTWFPYSSSARGTKALMTKRGCERCGIREQTFWDDPVGDLQTYLCEPRPSVKQIIAIAHNTTTFDLHFILSRAMLLKWIPELVMSGQKIILMNMEHIKFTYSLSFLAFPLRKLSDAFGLTSFSYLPLRLTVMYGDIKKGRVSTPRFLLPCVTSVVIGT